MKFQFIYDHSPIFFQNFMTSVYGYTLKRTRYGKYYHEHMQLLHKLHTYSKEQLQEYQLEEMMKLLRYVNEHSKFYNELYKNINIDDIKTIEDIKKLPIVTKEMLRKNIEGVITIPKKGAVADHTGGTTGKSLIVYNRVEDIQKRMAVLDFFKLKNGFENIKMKKATFMGKHIVPPNQKNKVFWRYNKPIKQMLYSSFHLTEENIPYYIDSLNDFKPVAIDGFVSSIYEIAFYIKRKNVKLKFQPKVIFPTSETLTEDYRKTIEEVFNCNVRDQYASSEGAPFVWECEYGNLHYDITKNPNAKIRLNNLSKKLKEYDYVVGNLESPLTNSEHSLVSKSMHLRSATENVELLKHLNINAVSLANNHIFDFGKKGMNETIKTLEDNRIERVEVDKKYLVKEINS